MCGLLRVHMYGTRAAADGWHGEYSGLLKKLGFAAGDASACVFRHAVRGLVLSVHGDDFSIAGLKRQIDWVKAQMEHQRGSSQTRAVTGHAAGRRDPGGDVVMQAVVAEESWSLQEQLESLSGAIQALTKGKGKGKDNGKGQGKGPHTHAAPGGAGGGKSAGKGRTGHFDGTCNHCGKYGHRKFECRTLDKEMADMKVKAGVGRGAPLAPGTLNEVGATDDGTWQWADDTAQKLQDSTGAEWSLGIGAVRKDVPPQPHRSLVTGALIQRSTPGRSLTAAGITPR